MGVRGATPEDLPVIREILQANGLNAGKYRFPPGAEIWYLVYERSDEVVGCIQVVPAQPLAWLDNHAVWPHLKHKGYGAKLYRDALRRCKRMGCAGVMGYIGEDNEKHLGHTIKEEAYRLDGKYYIIVREIR